jgi:pyridoxamine 5'-phosphate oxidase
MLMTRPLMDRDLPSFDPGPTPADPAELFVVWLTEAVGCAEVADPQAVTLSTVDAAGAPDARIVALRDVDLSDGAWLFVSDAASPKGTQLGARPAAAMTFYWPARGRQVRVRGTVEPSSPEVSAAEFLARSPASRVASLVGHQSEPLPSAARYDEAAADAAAHLAATPDAVPPGHTVYALRASEVEFWQGARDRHHIRLRYTRRPDSATGWTRALLWP